MEYAKDDIKQTSNISMTELESPNYNTVLNAWWQIQPLPFYLLVSMNLLRTQ